MGIKPGMNSGQICRLSVNCRGRGTCDYRHWEINKTLAASCMRIHRCGAPTLRAPAGVWFMLFSAAPIWRTAHAPRRRDGNAYLLRVRGWYLLISRDRSDRVAEVAVAGSCWCSPFLLWSGYSGETRRDYSYSPARACHRNTRSRRRCRRRSAAPRSARRPDKPERARV